MYKIKKIVSLFAISLLILQGCSSKEKEVENSVPNDTNTVALFKDAKPYPHGELQTLALDGRSVIFDAQITTHQEILLQEVSATDTKLMLHDLKTGMEHEIQKTSATERFGFAYAADDFIVYYTFKAESNNISPLAYFVYRYSDAETFAISLQEKGLLSEEGIFTGAATILEDTLYFEAQSNDSKSFIYAYDLKNAEVKQVVEGMQPQIYKGDLCYLQYNIEKNANDLRCNTTNEQVSTLAKDVKDFAIVDDIVVWTTDVNNTHSLFLSKEGKTELLLETEQLLFWNVSFSGKLIGWQQASEPLYMYNLETKRVYIATDAQNTGRSVITSPTGYYWQVFKENSATKGDNILGVTYYLEP